MTIRSLIQEYQKEIRDTDLTPQRAAEIISKLSALLGNVNDEIKNTQIEYNQVLLKYLDSEEKASRAKIRAEVSPEYQSYLESKNIRELVIEMIRGLKYLVRSYMEEYSNGRNI